MYVCVKEDFTKDVQTVYVCVKGDFTKDVQTVYVCVMVNKRSFEPFIRLECDLDERVYAKYRLQGAVFGRHRLPAKTS